MLKYLDIHNLAIIRHQTLTFDPGLTVITGETGAGKSIMVDILKLALGQRADQQWLKAPNQKGEVIATFDISHDTEAQQWLEAHDLEVTQECMIRRVIHPNKPSRCFINQVPCPLHTVKQLTEHLINIHSQHQYQRLLKSEVQRQLLDSFGDLEALAQQVTQAYQHWRQAQNQLKSLEDKDKSRHDRLQLVAYQAQELQALALSDHELQTLEAEHRQLAHAEELNRNCQQALNKLTEDTHVTASSLIEQACQQLQQVLPYAQTQSLANILKLLENIQIQLTEAASDLGHEIHSFEHDPQRLLEVQQRLEKIYDIARKHHIEPDKLVQLTHQLTEELQELETLEERVQAQRETIAHLEKAYLELAQSLSQKRQHTAESLAAQTTDQLKALAMPHAEFKVACHPTTQYSEHGIDQVQFQIVTNPGQSFQPLSQIASGGELSRISLALHVLVHQTQKPSCFIFDEVDVGIGGHTATVLGQMLKTLSQYHQVLCITHLPQVACFGDHHLHVTKLHKTNDTEITMTALNTNKRVEEIARMLGGFQVTDQSRAHAKELLSLT